MSELGGQLLANSMPNGTSNSPVSALDTGIPALDNAEMAAHTAQIFNNLLGNQWLQNQLNHPQLIPANPDSPDNPLAGNTLPPIAMLQAASGQQQPADFINLDTFTHAQQNRQAPVEGVIHTRLAMQQPLQAHPQMPENLKLLDSAEISTSFDELNLPGSRPLHLLAQSQLAVQPDASIAANSLSGAPAFSSLSQSVATYSSQAHLPPITAPLEQKQGLTELNERINWMIGSQVQKADMRLEPAELGSLEVRVTVTRDQANVTFNVSNAQAREAIESAIPRLREMFGESGVQLGNVDVSQHSFAENSDTNAEDAGRALGSVMNPVDEEETEHNPVVTRLAGSNGLLDLYA